MSINEKAQLLATKNHEVVITMSGGSLDDTIGKIFTMLKKQVYSDFNLPIVHMDTQEVYLENIDIVEKKETFLFFFMPRIKQYFTVTARIVLTVKYLDLKKEDN